MAPTTGKGATSVAFVHLSLTQQIIGEPKGLACPNLEWKFPTLDATRNQFQGEMVKGHN